MKSLIIELKIFFVFNFFQMSSLLNWCFSWTLISSDAMLNLSRSRSATISRDHRDKWQISRSIQTNMYVLPLYRHLIKIQRKKSVKFLGKSTNIVYYCMYYKHRWFPKFSPNNITKLAIESVLIEISPRKFDQSQCSLRDLTNHSALSEIYIITVFTKKFDQ